MLKAAITLFLIMPLFGNFNYDSINRNPKVHTVIIKEMKFQPSEIRVDKGDIVVWINKDIVTHNVTEEKEKGWASPALSAGKSWKMTVKKSFSYFCTLHPIMKGTIRVK